jgi:putative peptidoglycan lipid II flippase
LAVCGAGVLSSGAGLLDQSMAAWLPPGSVAALAYGGRIVGAVVALISTSISTVLMPFYSEAVARADWRACRESMQRVSRYLFAATIPLTLLLIATSHLLVRTLYQHGAFSAADSAVVARVQAMYALQLPFYGVAPVYLRFLVAIRRNDLIIVSAAINLTLDFFLNLLCMRWGPAGLALSTSLFYVVSFFFLRYWALRLLSERETIPATYVPATLLNEATRA